MIQSFLEELEDLEGGKIFRARFKNGKYHFPKSEKRKTSNRIRKTLRRYRRRNRRKFQYARRQWLDSLWNKIKIAQF